MGGKPRNSKIILLVSCEPFPRTPVMDARRSGAWVRRAQSALDPRARNPSLITLGARWIAKPGNRGRRGTDISCIQLALRPPGRTTKISKTTPCKETEMTGGATGRVLRLSQRPKGCPCAIGGSAVDPARPGKHVSRGGRCPRWISSSLVKQPENLQTEKALRTAHHQNSSSRLATRCARVVERTFRPERPDKALERSDAQRACGMPGA